MSAFGFDPRDRWPRRPRTVRGGPLFPRRRRIILGIAGAVVLVVVVALSLVGLRVRYLFLDSVGHTNVFWTPLVSQVVLFLIGLVLTAGLASLNLLGWVRVARNLDTNGPRVALLAGAGVCLIAGIAGGAYMASNWQDFQLFLHGHSFGHADPVFGQDYSFFLFTLPVLDHLQAIGWGVTILSLLSAIALAAACYAVDTAPDDIPIPLHPPIGRSARDGLQVAALHIGVVLVALFVLAFLGSHFGPYQLVTSQHDKFVGLDATQRNVTRPVLGILQVVALGFAVAAGVLLYLRRRSEGLGTVIRLGILLGSWLVVAGIAQTIPGAIYQAAYVGPNGQTAQHDSIADFLVTSRGAWALSDQQSGPNAPVDTRQFDKSPGAPTATDLAGEPGTLRNVRVQDYRQLKDAFAQVDRSKPYQNFPTITVDRYPDQRGNETQVMVAPKEIQESDVPNQSFVGRALLFTHGYGLTGSSVTKVQSDGNPLLYVGRTPVQQLNTDLGTRIPAFDPDSSLKDPRIYCGLGTSQPVVVDTQQQEFDYPGGSGDVFSSFGDVQSGIRSPGFLDKLAISIDQFKGLDLFLTSQLTDSSRVLLHREVTDRLHEIAPFLVLDRDPYVIADTSTGHLAFIADGYLKSDRFPDSYRQDDGTSYQRNAVKAVVDARTCETTLYAVDSTEPLTATYADIYPGLFKPLSQMPQSIKAHLRYPEDYFQNQARAYASVHITDPNVLFNGSDLYRLSQETLNGAQQETQAYYVELQLPQESGTQFVLLQTFSPTSQGGGQQSNIMAAWLAAKSDFTKLDGNRPMPELVAVPLNTSANVLGPQQFDNNINTDPDISKQLTLLGQQGSQVVLGNVIVLPFADKSFLYTRPLYVRASTGQGGTFPQLRGVIVGNKDGVKLDSSFAAALQDLYPTLDVQSILGPGSGPSPTPSPTPAPSPGPSPSPTPASLTQQQLQILSDLLYHAQQADQALIRGDLKTYGQEEAIVQADAKKLRDLGVPASAIPTASPSPGSPSP